MNVIFCRICSFGSFSPLTVVNHFAGHTPPYNCGVDSCSKTYTNLKSFKDHLRKYHCSFFPIVVVLPLFFTASSFSSQNNNMSGQSQSLDNVVASPSHYVSDCNSPYNDLGINPSDVVLDLNSKKFL